MRTISIQQIARHDALMDEAAAITDGEIWLAEERRPGKPGWFARRKLNKGLALYEQILEINPENSAAMWMIGKIYQRLRLPDKAFDYFKQAHLIDPEQPDFAREAGLTALDLGLAEEALHLCQRAIENDSKDPGLVANLAWAQVLMCDVATAQETIRKVVDDNPSDTISKAIQRVISEIASGKRPQPKSMLEIDGGG